MHHDSLVCAHRTYPFGTKLLVKNLTNNKEVIVTVVDRGPHRKGRIIDLTYAAAEQIGMITKGVVAVEVSVYHPDMGIPYALEPDPLPEIDLEEQVGEIDEDYNAAWTRKSTSIKKDEFINIENNTTKTQTKKNTNTKTKAKTKKKTPPKTKKKRK